MRGSRLAVWCDSFVFFMMIASGRWRMIAAERCFAVVQSVRHVPGGAAYS